MNKSLILNKSDIFLFNKNADHNMKQNRIEENRALINELSQNNEESIERQRQNIDQ